MKVIRCSRYCVPVFYVMLMCDLLAIVKFLVFQMILVFVVVRLLSRRVSDRALIFIGLFLESATIAYLLWFIPQATDGT